MKMKKTGPKKNRRTEAQQMATCWHEAGHAVADLVQGLAVNSVTCVPHDDANGCCTSPPPLGYIAHTKRERRAIARMAIIGSYAGMEAEWLIDPDAPESNGGADNQNAFWLSREYGVYPSGTSYMGDDIHQAYLARLRIEARRLVRRHRDKIQRLAELLAVRKTLSGAEAAECIGPTLR